MEWFEVLKIVDMVIVKNNDSFVDLMKCVLNEFLFDIKRDNVEFVDFYFREIKKLKFEELWCFKKKVNED